MSGSSTNGAGMDRATLERFADLIVGFGANVQPGQIVAVGAEPGKEPLTRAIARQRVPRTARSSSTSRTST